MGFFQNVIFLGIGSSGHLGEDNTSLDDLQFHLNRFHLIGVSTGNFENPEDVLRRGVLMGRQSGVLPR